MNKRKHKDISQLALSIVEQAIGEIPKEEPPKTKNPAHIAAGKLGGLKGGKVRAAKLSAKRRKEIAKKAIQTRWDNLPIDK